MNNNQKRDYSILIATCIDHFDTALYGFLAPVIAERFFPITDPIVALILTYSIYATSVVTRPVGTVIFGIIAKNYGPLLSLSYSLIGVAITTVLIGLVPDYSYIGFVAPILLIVMRGLREVFSAGEITIAKLYILEEKNDIQALNRSCQYQIFSMLGIVIASFLSTLVIGTKYDYWRFCFIFGGIIAGVGYFIRTFATNEQLKPTIIKAYSKKDNLSLLYTNKKIILKIAIVNSFSYITYSIPFIVMNSLILFITDIPFIHTMALNTILLVIDIVLLLLAQKLLSHYKIKIEKILFWSACCMLVVIFPLWSYIKDASFAYICMVRIIIIIIGVIFAYPVNLWMSKLVIGDTKYLITGIGSAIGSSIIGKMTPTFCLWLYYYTGQYTSIALYIMVMTIFTLVAIKLT